MRISIFSSKPYDFQFLQEANQKHGHDLVFDESRLSLGTLGLAKGSEAICAFVNDCLDEQVLNGLVQIGVRYILLRSAGFNHLDRAAASKLGLKVAYVPNYSPHAVAEHAVALILALNRKTHRAYARIREGNFSIVGLLGFDLHGKTVGVVGTGRIGLNFAKIMRGFGCEVIAYDPFPSSDAIASGIQLISLAEIFAKADIVSLHCPLSDATKHLVNPSMLRQCKPGLMLINTSRGALIDASAAIEALKEGRLGSLGIDVYEEEANLFYEDFSGQIIKDDVLSRLISFPNVLVTAHQGFFTAEALLQIAATTLGSASDYAAGRRPPSALV